MDGERWSIRHDGRLHEVHVRRRLVNVVVEWRVDGELVSRAEDVDSTLVLCPDEGHEPALGAVGVKAPTFLKATRRVVLRPPGSDLDDEPDEREPDEDNEPDADDGRLALLLSFNDGTHDLVPDPGTRGARRQQWIVDHPVLFMWAELLTAGRGLVGVLLLTSVVLPLLEHLFPSPDIDVDVPSVDLPDLPTLPLPSIPWPDIPDISLPSIPVPDWLWDVTKLVVVLAIAWLLSRREVKRLRAEMARRSAAEVDATDDRGADTSEAGAGHV